VHYNVVNNFVVVYLLDEWLVPYSEPLRFSPFRTYSEGQNDLTNSQVTVPDWFQIGATVIVYYQDRKHQKREKWLTGTIKKVTIANIFHIQMKYIDSIFHMLLFVFDFV
jgi:hypothetical protein